MEHKLEWQSEVEGQISFYDKETLFMRAEVFVTLEEEAELKLLDIVVPEESTENDKKREKIILKMMNCIKACFSLLWEEGFPETMLVAEQGTKIADILNSTNVVQKTYSECMLTLKFDPQKSTDCGQQVFPGPEDEDGILYENADKTFSCKIIAFEPEENGEAVVYLHGVEVEKKERNKGIATACLTGLFRQLAQNAPITVHLQVGSYNEPAWHLYHKMGFQISEEIGYYAMEEEP